MKYTSNTPNGPAEFRLRSGRPSDRGSVARKGLLPQSRTRDCQIPRSASIRNPTSESRYTVGESIEELARIGQIMKVLVAGANGFIGTRLCAAACEQGHDLTALVRDPERAARRLPAAARVMTWDAAQSGPWQRAVADADAVFN